MENSLFFSNIEETEINKSVIESIQGYSEDNTNEQTYLISAPLGEKKYKYTYEDKVIVILSTKHKIIFLDLGGEEDNFDEYYDDFIEDLGSISDKFNYKEYIGRPGKWKKELTEKVSYDSNNFDIKKILNNNKLATTLHRKSELLISLLVGSVNDIEKIGAEESDNLLEKVKNKIVLFDGDQTRFIYNDVNKGKDKKIYIQGLAGTGKTELLLHKLKEIYTQPDDFRIFFTCKNKILGRELKYRIPHFFNFMKVEKQIEWDKRLWVNNARGSMNDKHSGLYRYICDYYNLPFYTYGNISDFKEVINLALKDLEQLSDFDYAFDYILIDESQDFPNEFFLLCEKITRHQVYVAGDIFQDIFNNGIEDKGISPDFILNKCYRTDPRTLMFAQSIGMGLFEEKKLNWLTDKEWEIIGYKIDKNDNNVSLSREPIRRFEDLDIEVNKSMHIQVVGDTITGDIINIIKDIKKRHQTVTPNDIGIIYLDDYTTLCMMSNDLEYHISDEFGWNINKAFETKAKKENTLFISNQNHVKGLEFPFIICVTDKIKKEYKYRNALYTMLTRSFLESYLLVSDDSNLSPQLSGLDVINKEKIVKTKEPSEEEKEEIKKTIIEFNKTKNLSYREFLAMVFRKAGLTKAQAPAAREMLKKSKLNNIFEEEVVMEFLENNKKYF